MLTIVKVLNVNVVLVRCPDDKEQILLGRGIGFGKKVGEAADEHQIERVFALQAAHSERDDQLLRLFSDIPAVYFKITDEIIRFANDQLGVTIGENIFLVLPDHLHFAVERYKSGMAVTNRVSWEIRNFYPQEYRIGRYGLDRLNVHTGMDLPEEEAANITFHVINLIQNGQNESFDSMKAAKLVGILTNLIRYSMNTEPDTTSPLYARYITHTKYFVARFFQHTLLDSDETLYTYLKTTCKNPLVFQAMERIDRYFISEYHQPIPHEELAYFGLHLNRLF